MTYQIVENDVRLLRRILVARQLGYEAAAKAITYHLREKGLVFLLPEEMTPEQERMYINTLWPRDFKLAVDYGFIALPDYGEAIFLNDKWRNPKTLYVRLIERVPELGELGAICWTPEKDEYPDLELFIQAYELGRQEKEVIPEAPPSVFERLKRWLKQLQ